MKTESKTTPEVVKERPILFSAPMVNARLKGRKTSKRLTSEEFSSAAKGFSADVLKLNPHLNPNRKVGDAEAPSSTPKTVENNSANRGMNQTEQRWRDALEAQKRRGDIREFAFEPFQMRLADRTSYRPDFVSLLPRTSSVTVRELTELFERPAALCVNDEDMCDLISLLRLVKEPAIRIDEIKGAHIWEKNRIKFKMAKELFPWIEFRLWQWKKSEWTQLL